MSIKEEYAEKEEDLQRQRRRAKLLQETLEARIESEAAEKVESKIRGLNVMDMAVMTSMSLYPLLVTVLTAIRQEIFCNDFKAFFGAIWKGIVWLGRFAGRLADGAAILGDKITVPVLAAVVHWILWGLVILLIAGMVIAALCFVGFQIFRFYTGHGIGGYYGVIDSLTVLQLIVTLSAIVWFAEQIRAIVPINLLLLFLIIHAVYLAVRTVIIWLNG